MLLDLPEELLHSVFEALSPAARDTLRYTCHTLAKLGRSHEGVAHEAAAARACVLDELRRDMCSRLKMMHTLRHGVEPSRDVRRIPLSAERQLAIFLRIIAITG
jgi:hypothetical protein